MKSKEEKQGRGVRILTGGGNPDLLKKVEMLLDEGLIESLGGDAQKIRQLYEAACGEKDSADPDKAPERELAKELKTFADKVKRLLPFL